MMLEQELEKYLSGQTLCNCDSVSYRNIKNLILGFAEPREKQIAELEAQIEKMKKYIKACWVEENLNDYSSYITNASDEFRDLVKELNEEIRNGR